MLAGGREGAKENLDWFWGQIGAITDDSVAAWMDAVAPTAPMLAAAMAYSPAYAAFDMTTRFMSPYGSGPFYQNPLSSIVDKLK